MAQHYDFDVVYLDTVVLTTCYAMLDLCKIRQRGPGKSSEMM